MDSWGWIVVYALGLTSLQLLICRYLVSGGKPAVGEGSDRDSAQADRYTHPEIVASLGDGSQVDV